MTFAPSPTVPSGGDRDLGPGILITVWVELGVSGVVLLGRLFAQFRIHRKVVLDDYLMIMAWVSFPLSVQYLLTTFTVRVNVYLTNCSSSLKSSTTS